LLFLGRGPSRNECSSSARVEETEMASFDGHAGLELAQFPPPDGPDDDDAPVVGADPDEPAAFEPSFDEVDLGPPRAGMV